MHRAIDRLDPNRNPAPWVFTIVTNTVRDYWRSRLHKSRAREIDLEQASKLFSEDRSADPDRQLEAKEEAAAIHAALGALSENDRMVILLREYEQLNSIEIAEMLGVSPEAIRQRYSRALARLADLYKQSTGKEQRET
jgi:RNA polymerase sigma-70 factor (ECF subfamily)